MDCTIGLIAVLDITNIRLIVRTASGIFSTPIKTLTKADNVGGRKQMA